MWRYVHSWSKGYGPTKVFRLFPDWMMFLFKPIMISWIKAACWTHGIGRHSEEDIVHMASDDLRAVSRILGNKKFILGDEPCEDDCAIFGELSQAMWCMPGSPYEKLLNSELFRI